MWIGWIDKTTSLKYMPPKGESSQPPRHTEAQTEGMEDGNQKKAEIAIFISDN